MYMCIKRWHQLFPQCVQLHVMINEIINVAMWMKQSEKSGEMK